MQVDQNSREPLWDREQLEQPHRQRDKAERVRRMFDAIAPTYELVNTLFSGGRDAAWRRKSVSLARVGHSDRVLDVACGTGDFARAFEAANDPPPVIVGCDFAEQMLALAAARSATSLVWVQGDALCLPFANRAFTVASCAFGVRNFQDLEAGLREMHRVLEVGGRAVILEFSRPSHPLWRSLYEFYATRLMPIGASLVSRDRTGAYRYLPKSVVSFPDPADLCELLHETGFSEVSATPMTLGIVTVYVAHKGR
jgi:demethylmenaquinone methyltransferase/2-methoxy-6-polyprenyl-1,4-benzoquinol methylase